MIATHIAPLTQWSSLAADIGVTWQASEFTADNPVVSTWVAAAYAEDQSRSLEGLLRRALQLQTADGIKRDSEQYYRGLPRRGQLWKPSSYEAEEMVVWTVRRSNGNHHAYTKDITASVKTRHDGCVVPSLRNGIGNSITELILVCSPGTKPAAAVRQLIAEHRSQKRALAALAVAMQS